MHLLFINLSASFSAYPNEVIYMISSIGLVHPIFLKAHLALLYIKVWVAGTALQRKKKFPCPLRVNNLIVLTVKHHLSSRTITKNNIEYPINQIDNTLGILYKLVFILLRIWERKLDPCGCFSKQISKFSEQRGLADGLDIYTSVGFYENRFIMRYSPGHYQSSSMLHIIIIFIIITHICNAVIDPKTERSINIS